MNNGAQTKLGRFRFDALQHLYFDLATGDVLPHITGLLSDAGLVNDLWYTEEARERGTEVHRLTADYDLGALKPDACVSRYRPYILAHAQFSTIVRPHWHDIEEARVHPLYRFGGRPDRVGTIDGVRCVCDIKTGPPEPKAHPIQTALQAILVAPLLALEPERIHRYGLYLKPSGRFRLLPYEDRRDYKKAYDIIREFCS